MPIWRLWLNGKATLEELETTWSYDDVIRANAILDIDHDIQIARQQEV
jgi:hypothetical protein